MPWWMPMREDAAGNFSVRIWHIYAYEEDWHEKLPGGLVCKFDTFCWYKKLAGESGIKCFIIET